MRYPPSEKLEIIRLVEQSHLPVKRTLAQLGIARTTFYRWYERYQTGGPDTLQDRSSRPGRVWNRIPDDVRKQIIDFALEEPELSPRELAVQFTDTERYFVICCNVLGGCMGSTGPVEIDPETDQPHGVSFPVITISDMVRAQVLVLDHLGIGQLFCVIGGSMGGMQVLEFAARFPERVFSAVPIAAALRCLPWWQCT